MKKGFKLICVMFLVLLFNAKNSDYIPNIFNSVYKFPTNILVYFIDKNICSNFISVKCFKYFFEPLIFFSFYKTILDNFIYDKKLGIKFGFFKLESKLNSPIFRIMGDYELCKINNFFGTLIYFIPDFLSKFVLNTKVPFEFVFEKIKKIKFLEKFILKKFYYKKN